MIAAAILYILFVAAAFDHSAALGALTLLVIGPIGALLYLVMARVFLESVIAQIRTAENTRDMLRAMQGGAAAAPPMQPGPYPPPPGAYGPYGSTG